MLRNVSILMVVIISAILTSCSVTQDSDQNNLNAPASIKSSSSGAIPSGNVYEISPAAATGQALADMAYCTTNGSTVGLWVYGGGNDQKWKFVLNSDGYYQIDNVNSGLAIDDKNGGTANGTYVQQWSFAGANQEWTINTEGSYYVFINRNSQLALDDTGNTANGTLVWQWTYAAGNANQEWVLTLISGSSSSSSSSSTSSSSSSGLPAPGQASGITSGWDYEITAESASGQALADLAFATTNGSSVALWAYGNGNDQKWTVTYNNDGYYKIVNVNSGLAIDDKNGGTVNGTLIQQWTYGGANQEWAIYNISGYYCLINRTSGLALDDTGATANGTLPWQWAYAAGNVNQEWGFTAVSASSSSASSTSSTSSASSQSSVSGGAFWGNPAPAVPAGYATTLYFVNDTGGAYANNNVYWSVNANSGGSGTIASQDYFFLPTGQNGRVYFGLGAAPNAANPNAYWDFIEFAVGQNSGVQWINCDTTRVDALGLPLAMWLVGPGYSTQVGEVQGVFNESRAAMIQSFENFVPSQFQGCATTYYPYRIVEPGTGAGFNAGGANQNYYNSYETQIWDNNGITVCFPRT